MRNVDTIIDTCGKCHGGWIYPENDKNLGMIRCQCLIEKINKNRFNMLLKKSNIEDDLHMTFDNFKPRNRKQNLAYMKMSEGGTFYVFGPYGTGKTHLSTAIVIKKLKAGIPAAKISIPAYLKEIRKFKEEQIDIEKMAMEIPYLVLDDLGKEKITDWVQERFFDLVDKRYRGFKSFKLQTTATSQVSLKNLRLDGAIVDRITGMCEEIFIDGVSYRQIKKEK